MPKSLTVAVRDFIAIDNQVTKYQVLDIAPSTRHHYDECWQLFVDFTGPLDAWKAQPIDVARWMAAQAMRGVSPLTIQRRSHALNYYYEKLGKGGAFGKPGVGTRKSPVRDLVAQKTLKGIFRKHGRPTSHKLPIMLETLELMIDSQPDELSGIRNRAILIVGWGAALRVTEVTALDVTPRGGGGNGWVEISNEGVIVKLRRSKRNQAGKHLEQYAIPARPNKPTHCPVQLLRAWLKASEIKSGPLFPCVRHAFKPQRKRLRDRWIRNVIKRSADRIGVDASQVSGHSLRSGCLSWLDSQRVPLHRIRLHSGHEHLRSILPYLRRPLTIRESPLAETSWVK